MATIALQALAQQEREANNASSDVDITDAAVEASRTLDADVPDGGYGWVVITCCAIVAFWFGGITYSWGVVQDALVEKDLASPSTLAFVGSTAIACIAAFAIINARLVRWIGIRKVGFIAICMISLGQILSGFTTHNVAGLFITAGVITGYGSSCSFMVVSVTPSQYFKNKRGLANGIVFAGTGLGGAAVSLALSSMLRAVGIAWTYRIIGFAVLVTGLPAVYLIKERVPESSTSFIEWQVEVTQSSYSAESFRRLFRDTRFVLVFLAGVIVTFPLFVPPFFLPLYAQSIHLSPQIGAALVACFNFSSAVGRVLCGFLGDRLGPVNTLIISLMLTSVSMLAIWPVSTSIAPLIVFVIINGMSNGGFFAIMPTVVGNVFGSSRVSVAMSMVVTGWFGGYLMGAPVAGYILDATGGPSRGFKAYRPAIFYAGSMVLGALGLLFFLRFRMSKSPLKRL